MFGRNPNNTQSNNKQMTKRTSQLQTSPQNQIRERDSHQTIATTHHHIKVAHPRSYLPAVSVRVCVSLSALADACVDADDLAALRAAVLDVAGGVHHKRNPDTQPLQGDREKEASDTHSRNTRLNADGQRAHKLLDTRTSGKTHKKRKRKRAHTRTRTQPTRHRPPIAIQVIRPLRGAVVVTISCEQNWQ